MQPRSRRAPASSSSLKRPIAKNLLYASLPSCDAAATEASSCCSSEPEASADRPAAPEEPASSAASFSRLAASLRYCSGSSPSALM
jgi:hypothetical protein